MLLRDMMVAWLVGVVCEGQDSRCFPFLMLRVMVVMLLVGMMLKDIAVSLSSDYY